MPLSPLAQKASDLFDAGDMHAAIDAYSAAIQSDPSNAGLYSDRGASKHRLNDYEGALADYAQAVRLRPRHVQARLNAAIALQKLNRHDEALHAFDAAIVCDPGRDVEAHAHISECATALGRPVPIPRIADIRACVAEANADSTKALAAYDRAIGINSTLASLFVGRALAHKSLNDRPSALADLDRAIAMRPEYANAFLERGLVKSAAGDLQGAADDAASAYRIDPTFIWAYNNSASALTRLGRPQEALNEVARAFAIDPDFAYGWLNSAMARAALKQDEQALTEFRRAFHLDPSLTSSYRGSMIDCQMAIALRRATDAEARRHYDAGVAAIDAKDNAKAITDLTAAIHRAADVPAFYLQRGLARLYTNKHDDAAADLRKAAELWPGFAMAWSNLAYTFVDVKKWDEAIEAATRGLAIEPDSPYLNAYAARALAGKTRHADALPHFDRAILHYPDVPGVYWSRALSRWETKDWNGVIADMNLAVGKDASMAEEARKWIPLAQEKLKSAAPAPTNVEFTISLPADPKLRGLIERALGSMRLNDTAAIIRDLMEARASGWRDAQGFVLLGGSLRTAGDLRNAIAVWNDALQIDPALPNVREWIKTAAAEMGYAAPVVAATSPNAPPTQVPVHAGEAQPPNRDFFAGPPQEIGSLISAATSLTAGEVPKTTGQRLVSLAIWCVVMFAIGAGIDWLASVTNQFWYYAWPGGLLCIGAFISWSSSAFAHTCTYIGHLGIARYACTGRRDNLTEQRVMLFQNVTELRTSATRRFTNGVYQGTDYAHSWCDDRGGVHFVVSGSHQAKDGLPGSLDLYHFAVAAERAWSLFLLDRADDQLSKSGFLHFSIQGRDYVRVAPDSIELSIGGKQEKRPARDIASISLNAGSFTIKTVDAGGWFFKKGIFSFEYGKMANVRLFILALDKLAKITVT